MPTKRAQNVGTSGMRIACILATFIAVTTLNASVIHVVDDATGRGVPLVELKTVDHRAFYTDSNGYASIIDQDLWGKTVYFHVSSHGYEHPADGFGFRGRAIPIGLDEQDRPQETEIKLRRLNVAERLYRVTGAGIYAHSVLSGKAAPLEFPLLNAGVIGQDSVQTTVLDDRVYWFWGDTNRLEYPLGHFGTAGAVSKLPGQGGLPAAEGIDLTYFADKRGFSRPMFDMETPEPIWLDGVTVVSHNVGPPTIVGHYSKMKDLGTRLSHGIAVFDMDAGKFEKIVEFPNDAPLYPQGQAFHVQDAEGVAWIYFATPYPCLRVKASWDDILNPAAYESWTPLPAGTRDSQAAFDREVALQNYAWRSNTAFLDPVTYMQFLKAERLAADDDWGITRSADTGRLIELHRGSVRWNAYRQKWILIAVETGGDSSFLGEVWYAESTEPHGPFSKAVKVVTHDNYSLYNPTQHAFFDEDGGRYVYFEGTYSKTFERGTPPTPRYDYNQIMYRLDLADPRLEPARVEPR